MEERYEIRGKIGQGGLGAVYRGFDTRMNREVAIKRIPAASGDPALQEESTRQLIKEAGALASLQHPHIVTIYDVGSDEDGPYVVMELISGKTLDEIIERAPLTWPDFRELAMQTQEALIAAQELELIHSDIKPSNLMLTWLPSGKFQMKIVDFGLATLTHSQSKEELEELEAVFGSIFFMAPEQFERVPLDARTDIYAMGCVYYQSLTGIYPFDGQTGNEVMNAHLTQAVTPLQEVRGDIPVWACDWIMWQINRMPQDRPASSRECLGVFLQNDKVANPKMSKGVPASQLTPTQSRQNGPKTIRVPRSATPAARVELGQQPVKPIPQAFEVPEEKTGYSAAIPVPTQPIKTSTAPQPLLPPEGSKPSVHTSSQPLPATTAPLTASMQSRQASGPIHVTATNPIPAEFFQHKKPKISKSHKITIASVLGSVVIIATFLIMKLGGGNAEQKAINEMLTIVAKPETTQLPVDKAKLNSLLEATSLENNSNVLKALTLAKSTDATDVDASILKFATQSTTVPVSIKEQLISQVLQDRHNPEIIGPLLNFAKSASDPLLAVAALHAMRPSISEDQFKPLLELLQNTAHDNVRDAAEETLARMIIKSRHPSIFSSQLSTAYINSANLKIRKAVLRLLARCGGDQAKMLVKSSLASDDRASKEAAISALGVWGDDSAYPLLIDLLKTTTDSGLRAEAFDSAFLYVSEPENLREPNVNEGLWTKLAAQAKSPAEQKKLITGLADYGRETWAYQLISTIGRDPKNDSSVIKLAGEILNKLRARN